MEQPGSIMLQILGLVTGDAHPRVAPQTWSSTKSIFDPTGKKLFKNIYDYSIDVNKYPYWFLFQSTNSYGRLLGSNAPWQPWLPFSWRTTIARLEISGCRYSDIVKCMGIRTGTDFSDFYFWPHMRYRIFGRCIIQNGLNGLHYFLLIFA